MRRLLLLAALGAATGCAAGPKAAAVGDVRASGPPIAFEGVRLVAYRGATPTWILRASRVGYDSPAAHLDQVVLTSYRDGRKISVARAPSADLDSRTGLLAMKGPVEVRARRDNAAFSADSVDWHATTQRLLAVGHVVFCRGGSRLEGAELSADSQLKRVRISGPVRARMALPLGPIGREP